MTQRPIVSSAALATALTIMATAGCSHFGREPGADAASGMPVAVRVIRAESAAGAYFLELPGRVRARSEVTLASTISGRVTALPVSEGGSFRRGATLALFQDPASRQARNAAGAALLAARDRRDQAVRQQGRMDTLLAARVASAREQELASSDRRAADAQYAQALAMDQALASGTTVAAPFDGVVVRKRVDAGADVVPGSSLLDIHSMEGVEIEVAVPESELSRLPGLLPTFQAGDEVWEEARLVRMDGMTDPATRTRAAYFRPAGGTARLIAGAFARVRLGADARAAAAVPSRGPAAGIPSTISVPDESVVHRGGLAGVYVLRDGHARLRWLRTGALGGGRTEVLAGLHAGEQVILRPEGLFDGRPVRVEP